MSNTRTNWNIAGDWAKGLGAILAVIITTSTSITSHFDTQIAAVNKNVTDAESRIHGAINDAISQSKAYHLRDSLRIDDLERMIADEQPVEPRRRTTRTRF